jgi:hypothetical protein
MGSIVTVTTNTKNDVTVTLDNGWGNASEHTVQQFDLAPVLENDSYKTMKFQIKRIEPPIKEKKAPEGAKVDTQMMLLVLASTNRARKQRNRFLSINDIDGSGEFLKFCREHRVPFGKKGNLDNHQIDYVGDYAHALHNGRYPDGALTDGEEFTLNIKKKYQAVYTQLTLGAKMTSIGNLAYFFKKKNQEKLHIKCIMKPDADKYILLKTKSTKKKGNIQNRWIHLKPTQEKKFLDFCRRYNVASEDDWLQNTLSLSDIPLREDKDESTNRQSMLFTHKQVWSHGHQCYVAENEVNSKATGSYIFTIRHANAPEKLFLNTDICQEALHEFGTKQEEQQTEQERRKGLGKLAGKVTGLGRGLTIVL